MSVSALRRGRATAPAEETSRLMECVECHDLIRVYEIPHRLVGRAQLHVRPMPGRTGG